MDRDKLKYLSLAVFFLLLFIGANAFPQSSFSGTALPIQQGGTPQGAATVFNCSTNLTCSLSGGVVTMTASGGSGTVSTSGSPATTQIASFTAGTVITGIDFPNIQVFPVGIWNGTSENMMWNVDGTSCVPNTLGSTFAYGVAQCLVNGWAFFTMALPEDWNTANQPYVAIQYGVAPAAGNKTVIWTVATSCSSNGVAISDATYHAESAYATINVPTSGANKTNRSSGKLTQVTSGNGCVPGGYMNVKFTLSGTTTGTSQMIIATVTTPRLLVVQAN